MRTFIKLTAIVIILLQTSCNDQQSDNPNTWNWSSNLEKEQEQWVLLTDYVKMEKYDKAKEHLNWLLKENPKLNSSLYKFGSIIYENLIDNCDDPIKMNRLKDEEEKLKGLKNKYFALVI